MLPKPKRERCPCGARKYLEAVLCIDCQHERDFPAEHIEAGCEAYRQTWSKTEERKRRGMSLEDAYFPPVIQTAEVVFEDSGHRLDSGW